eukprot:PhF_6_TR1442/c0_g1_i2/m.2561
MYTCYGFHSVMSILQTNRRTIYSCHLHRHINPERKDRILSNLPPNIPIHLHSSLHDITALCHGITRHNGVSIQCSGLPVHFNNYETSPSKPFLGLVCGKDVVGDPGTLGAVLRVAAFFRVNHCIILCENQRQWHAQQEGILDSISSPIASKTSAGAIEDTQWYTVDQQQFAGGTNAANIVSLIETTTTTAAKERKSLLPVWKKDIGRNTLLLLSKVNSPKMTETHRSPLDSVLAKRSEVDPVTLPQSSLLSLHLNSMLNWT